MAVQQIQLRIDDDEACAGIDHAQSAHQLVDGKHGEHGRKRIQKQQDAEDGFAPGKLSSGEDVGSRDARTHCQRHGAGCEEQRVCKPTQYGLFRKYFSVIAHGDLCGNKMKIG